MLVSALGLLKVLFFFFLNFRFYIFNVRFCHLEPIQHGQFKEHLPDHHGGVFPAASWASGPLPLEAVRARAWPAAGDADGEMLPSN